MKATLLRITLLASVIFTMNSCSSDASESADQTATEQSAKVVNYSYNETEIATMDLINEYRVSVGLNALERINHISFKSEEHDDYMITNKVVNHNDFVSRSENIIKVLGASRVGENIAYNFTTPEAVVAAWLNSPTHKENVVGNYTHFGIAIKADPVTGKKYYTNIFAKI
ncbi:CAP domain-containing protein [Flavobacterium algicola]|uniref:CAP domain-containing protein n=1 Tax=Flavobacterium algicola TaxID=556529 RepID=UPI001EFEAD2E|nr:CAP domain-containing protein [Flavobacterium algicola]MCG9792761.1 CAP domain-containing protein [Flavobacterium algicola]